MSWIQTKDNIARWEPGVSGLPFRFASFLCLDTAWHPPPCNPIALIPELHWALRANLRHKVTDVLEWHVRAGAVRGHPAEAFHGDPGR
jgi:hypothetical protein